MTECARRLAVKRFESQRSEQFLRACSSGDVSSVRFMLARGCPPDSVDYDHRTGLMVAAACGHKVRIEHNCCRAMLIPLTCWCLQFDGQKHERCYYWGQNSCTTSVLGYAAGAKALARVLPSIMAQCHAGLDWYPQQS